MKVKGTSTFELLKAGHLPKQYTTVVTLIQGTRYEFNVKARNSVGFSLVSSTWEVLAAQVPFQPNAPKTTVVGSDVEISWDLPNNGGSVITAYKIEILEENGLTYSVVPLLAFCDGTLPSVIADRKCSVPFTSLMTIPFSLLWGAQIVARITANNVYGASVVSLPTAQIDRAIILRIPDTPLSLTNNLVITFGTNIGLKWAAGPESGGTPVLDYTLESV